MSSRLENNGIYCLFFPEFQLTQHFPAEQSIFKHNSKQQRGAIGRPWNGKNTPESNTPVKDLSKSLESIRTACNRSKASNDLFLGRPSD